MKRIVFAFGIIALLALVACSDSSTPAELAERYGQYCGEAVDEIYDCGDYVKGQRNNLGGGIRWFDAASGEYMDCPVVGPDSMTPGCKALLERQETMECVKVLDCPAETDDGAQLTNPASQSCIDKGGELEIRDTPDGQIGVCLLDGQECEEWALFRGEGCIAPETDMCAFCCSDEADGRCAAVTCDCAAYRDEEPRICCKALTATCLACAEGVSVEAYCAENTGTMGCDEAEPSRDGYVACTEPRPEMCTMQYDPVCAEVDTGIRCITEPCPSTEWKTYGNGCSACGDADVLGYVPGECAGEAA